ncbi:MAG: HIT domain-containing protein [Clostridia bacterium]|nr:HIT domain-containing protein [Clostridia bacterium]
MEDCLFCKIIAGDIPSKKAYEDEDMYVFADIDYLCVPKTHFKLLSEMTEDQAETLKRCLQKIPALNGVLDLSGGYRLVINQGDDAGQSVHHLHIHILAGKKMQWNPA